MRNTLATMFGHSLRPLRKADSVGALGFALALAFLVIAALNSDQGSDAPAPLDPVTTTPEPTVLGTELTSSSSTTTTTTAPGAPTSAAPTTAPFSRPTVDQPGTTPGPTIGTPVSVTAPPRTTTTRPAPTTTTTRPATTTTTEATTTTEPTTTTTDGKAAVAS